MIAFGSHRVNRFSVFSNLALAVAILTTACGGRAATIVEEYILKAAAHGGVANVSNLHPRVFPAEFLHKLLTLPIGHVTPKGVRVQGAIFEDDADFAFPNIEAPYDVRFENCEFRSGLNLSGCHFRKNLSFLGSTFKGEADFEGIKIDGRLDLTGVTFEDAMKASQGSIGGALIGIETVFKGGVDFKEIKVGHSVQITSPTTNTLARFLNMADWQGAAIEHHLILANTQFEGAAKFDGVKVGQSIAMQNCRFSNDISFGYAKIADDFDASYSQFTDPQMKANFYGLKCGSFTLDGATFAGPCEFGITSIANDLSLCGAQFESEREITFYATDVKGTVYLDGARFHGPVNFLLAHVGGNFSAIGVNFQNSVDLRTAKKSDDGSERQSTFNADFGSLAVEGFSFFNDSSFAGDISFRNARIQNLILDRITWPATDRLLRLEGLTYQRIRSITNKVFFLGPKDLAQSWNNLRNTLHEYTPYSYDVYENLESYFLREGQPALANEVYIEGRRRERLHASFTAKAWNFFLDWTVGHGRDPARAFIISIIPLLLGAGIFERKNMQPLQEGPQPYHPLWFSLDLLLPVVGLWIKDKWEPKPGKKSVWFYACLHKFLGWVLIPTGLAAFAGIVK